MNLIMEKYIVGKPLFESTSPDDRENRCKPDVEYRRWDRYIVLCS